jgi:hypothetical protein
VSERDPVSFRQTADDRVEIGASATYRYASRQPKPCVHPVVTPRGHVLSGFEMSDHVWHRGLWFTIKFVNGANFWEEHPPFGAQVSRRQPACQWIAPDAVRLTHELDWTSQSTGTAIRETRAVTFRTTASGIGMIDWATELRAAQDLMLDRTPYTTWGGYGGLAFRGARELHDVNFLLPGGETVTALAGQRHGWTIMQAKVDGGHDQRISLAMIDHPSNPRSPSPWYCKSGNGFNYMNPAFLFHEPMMLKNEQSLRFRYRVLYRDGCWSATEFAALADAFRAGEES